MALFRPRGTGGSNLSSSSGESMQTSSSGRAYARRLSMSTTYVGSKSKAGKLPMRHRRLACLSAAYTTRWGGIGRAASGCCATGTHRPPDCGVVDEAVAVRSNAEHEQPENGDKTKRPYD